MLGSRLRSASDLAFRVAAVLLAAIFAAAAIACGTFAYWALNGWNVLAHHPAGRAPAFDRAASAGLLLLFGWPMFLIARRLWRGALERVSPGPEAHGPEGQPLCPGCGYDLRGTPDHCPECGTVLRAGTGEP